ncbi:hypothetical protein VN97_g7968 [Penicillium thymicola]|uniref:Uncharacterized protein n=1 Tax=Penicillium thymicola TaxID=293382 RepID=A0AAI9TE93_PENTH|nr:hypothetical protein VN97_g7968 [Penicillium thymicola]
MAPQLHSPRKEKRRMVLEIILSESYARLYHDVQLGRQSASTCSVGSRLNSVAKCFRHPVYNSVEIIAHDLVCRDCHMSTTR